jgi:beta-ureidopropionase
MKAGAHMSVVRAALVQTDWTGDKESMIVKHEEYDRHFPEGWRALGLNGAQIVFNPSATSRGLSQYLWSIEQPAAAVANEYYVGAINRVGIEPLGDDDFYGQSYFVDPEGNYVGEKGDPYKSELIVRDLDLDLITTVRNRWAFYRDRRPDAYDDLVRP